MIFDSPALQRRLFLKLLGGSFSAAATLTSTFAFAADKKRLVRIVEFDSSGVRTGFSDATSRQHCYSKA